jgi:DNA-binding MarR family transcriptional regulator
MKRGIMSSPDYNHAPSGTTTSALSLGEQFAYASRLLFRRNHRTKHESFPFADRTRGQGRVLALLRLQPEISLKDLGTILGIRNQSASELVIKLEKAGYVTKTQASDDLRAVSITLTDKGRDAANAAHEKSQEPEDAFVCLSDEERSTLSECLAKIIATLQSESDERDIPMDAWQGFDDGRFCGQMHDHGDGHGHRHRNGRGCPPHAAHRNKACQRRGAGGFTAQDFESFADFQ